MGGTLKTFSGSLQALQTFLAIAGIVSLAGVYRWLTMYPVDWCTRIEKGKPALRDMFHVPKDALLEISLARIDGTGSMFASLVPVGGRKGSCSDEVWHCGGDSLASNGDPAGVKYTPPRVVDSGGYLICNAQIDASKQEKEPAASEHISCIVRGNVRLSLAQGLLRLLRPIKGFERGYLRACPESKQDQCITELDCVDCCSSDITTPKKPAERAS